LVLKVVGISTLYLNSLRKLRTYSTFLLASVKAIYSASVVDRVTVGCNELR